VAEAENAVIASAFVITEVAEAVQPFPSVPTTVYVVVEDGVAITVAPVDADKPEVGVQEYVLAPEAVIVIPVPGAQYKAEVGVTETTGNALTVKVADETEFAPHPSVTVTVYVPEFATVALGKEITAEVDVNPPGPVHA